MTEPVLWVNDPMGAALLGETSWRSLYDITDDWLLADRTPLTIERLKRQEAELFARCQAVVVCSEGLLRTKSTLRDVILIPNGVDLEPYHVMQDRPEDLPAGRVALYLGTAHQDRFDTAICARTAALLASDESSRPSATVVLIGPAPLPTSDLVTLRDAGAHVLGPRPSHLVPAYLQHADVLLVPHVLTDFTASLDPIKAYEYRAARRPVVATLVPGFSDTSDPLVRAVHGEDFPTTVADVLTQQVPWSSDLPDDIPSWRSRVDQMAAVVRLTADGGRVP